jgi:serine protease
VNLFRKLLGAGLPLALLALPLLAAPREQATDRVIIKWAAATEPDAEPIQLGALGNRIGHRLALTRKIGGEFALLRLEREYSGTEMTAVLTALRADPRIAIAEPDRRVHIQAYVPNDPLFAGQWYLKSIQLAGIRADAAWDITKGGNTAASSPVVVAVIDSGVRFDHPDLRTAASGGKLLPGFDFVSGDSGGIFATANDGNGWDTNPEDPGDFISAADLASGPFAGKGCGANNDNSTPTSSSWHGTRTAGMIGADSDNAQGIAGTGFNIRVVPVRALGKCGGYDSDVLAAMYWSAGMSIPPPLVSGTPIVNPNPAQIINMSLGGTGPCSATYTEAVRDITARGVLIVVSAGNEGSAVDSPANCAGTLAVAGLRHVGTKVGYSNLGPEVGISAPAGNCVNLSGPCLFSLDTATDLGSQNPAGPGYTDQIRFNVGTSFSSPLAAGTAGLMKAVNPSLTPALIISRIRATARAFPVTSDTVPLPPMCQLPGTTVQNNECLCNTQVCGAGMLDAGAAVTEALRPAVLAKATGEVGIGRTLTLDGAQSGAATGRTISSFAWTVTSTSGGAATPTISAANQSIATVVSPSTGAFVVQLLVTDSQGATGTASITVTAASTGSTSPPPTPIPPPRSGGGELSIALLLSLMAMLGIALPRRFRARK